MRRYWIKALLCVALIASFVLTPLSALAAGNAGILIVNTKGARLRSPDNMSVIKTSLKQGTRVVYAGKRTGAMLLVRTSSGQVGYVYSKYLSAYGAAPISQICKITATTAVYKNENGHPKKIGAIKAGTTVVVYEVRGSWAYIKTLSGKSCYIKKAYLKRL